MSILIPLVIFVVLAVMCFTWFKNSLYGPVVGFLFVVSAATYAASVLSVYLIHCF
jgi:hypothetical protein